MLKRELLLFVVNGLVSVTIAYCVYHRLVASGLPIELASGIAYLTGMVYGFFANKHFTFRDQGKESPTAKIGRYVLLHMGTLLVNVVVNSFMLGLLRGLSFDMLIAFALAIGISTVLNFIGMKYWVFKRSAEVPSETSNKIVVGL